MIVVKQSDLGDMPLDVLRQVMGLPDSELIVCIDNLDNGDRIPPLEPEPVEPQAVPPLSQQARQTAPADVVARGPVEGATAFRYGPINSGPTDCGSAAHVNASSPMAPPEQPADIALPSSGADRVMKQGGASGHIDRPPRLPEHGCTYAQLCEAAAAVRMDVRLGISGSGVILTDPLAGAVAYPDWPSAIRVINARRDFGILGYARGVIGG